MSSFNKYKWELVPMGMPAVKRNCPKCGRKTLFVNTKKFRVNANKNNIDVWLIYQCDKCRSTWNMSILERVNPRNIDSQYYDRFLNNDMELAEEYGFNRGIYEKNKCEIVFQDYEYKLDKEIIEESGNNKESIINIISKIPSQIRIDKLLSDNLELSRNKIKLMFDDGNIFSEEREVLPDSKIGYGLSVHIKYK